MTKSAPNVMIVSGEASGDMHGAYLASELKRMLPDIQIKGIGGRKMREAGVGLLYDSSAWSAIGVTEAWKLIPSLLATLRKLRANLRANPPDLLILIDFGAFNVRLAQGIRGSGIEVLYYFPPGSWRRGATHRVLQGLVDRIVTPFPWSAERLREQGFRVDFFGHPLLDIVRSELTRQEFCARFGFDSGRPIIGLLPGSRKQELKYNLPPMLIAAGKLASEMPELQFAMPLASSINAESVLNDLAQVSWIDSAQKGSFEDTTASGIKGSLSLESEVSALAKDSGFNPPESPVRLNLLPGMAWEILGHSRAAILASGTATVEATVLGCPMVIIYRLSRISALEYKLRGKKIKFIGMPNIIADRMICPEYVGDDVVPNSIYETMMSLIPDSPQREKQLSDLDAAKAVLGQPGAIEKTAEVALDLLGLDNGRKNA